MASRILTFGRAVSELECERTDLLPSGLEQEDNLCLSKEDLNAIADAAGQELAIEFTGYDDNRLVPEDKVSVAFPNKCSVTIDEGLFPNGTDIWTLSQKYDTSIPRSSNSVEFSGKTDTLTKTMATRPQCTSYRRLKTEAVNKYIGLSVTYNKNALLESITQPGYVEFVDNDNSLSLGYVKLQYDASNTKKASASDASDLAKAVFSVQNLLVREKKMKTVKIVNNLPSQLYYISVNYNDIEGVSQTLAIKGNGGTSSVTTSGDITISSTDTALSSNGGVSSGDRKTLYFRYGVLLDGQTITISEYTSSGSTEDFVVKVKIASRDYESGMWDYAVGDSKPESGSSNWKTLSPSFKSITIPYGSNMYVRYNDTRIETPFYMGFSDSLSIADYQYISSSNVITANYSSLSNNQEYTVYFNLQ